VSIFTFEMTQSSFYTFEMTVTILHIWNDVQTLLFSTLQVIKTLLTFTM